MGALLLGIDVGTASTKGVLLRPDGSTVAEARVDHGMDIPRPGWAEQDADAIWWADVVAICRRLVAAVRPGDALAGIGCSAIGPTLVHVDAGVRPLRPAILYGVDTRATTQIAALEARHGKADLTAFSGHALSSQAVGPKIVWIREQQPDVDRAARWLLTASSYLGLRLTAELAIDVHTASHWNPLFDTTALAWSTRYADGITGLERLPRIGWPVERLGGVSARAAAETGLPEGLPVALGTVDVQAEAVSVGVVEPGDLMVMYGSTTFLILVTDRPVAADPLWLVAGAEPGTRALAAGLATGGSALAWFRDRFAPDLVAAEDGGGRNAFAALAAEAAVDPVDAGAGATPVVLPSFSGERTPVNDPLARGVIAGLSLRSTRGDVYRGLVDGIALAVRANVEAMRALGMPIRRAVAVGGGTADASLMQAVSDATGLAQDVPEATVGAARGDAFLAGRAAGLLTPADLAGWVRHAGFVEPDAGRAAMMSDRAELAGELFASTRDVVHRLAETESG
ncbi:MAG TPA: FGGY family carbohydrate kinase [Candidatus Acidoferrum sp.]|nr:FGGY family carbohydrate kinase [Candidatus Acidoferrum sp.]